MFKNIEFRIQNEVAWITLNRPEALNSLTDGMEEDLLSILEQCRLAQDISIVVLTGKGNKAFCAGADIEMLDGLDSPIAALNKYRRTRTIQRMVREIPKPVIAMLNGLTLGGGLELAMGCDIIIASENAKFGLPEIKLALIPGAGGTQMLPRLIGEKRAKELIYTGDFFSAQEALHMGIVNKVVPPEKLEETTLELLSKLKQRSAAVLRIAKLAVNNAMEMPLSQGLASELDLFSICFSTEDCREGLKAFRGKRTPIFKGK